MTAVHTEIKMVGLKEAVKELNNIDKSARRELTREYKRIVEPVISEAKQRVPLGAPISGWNRSWTTKSGKQLLPWDGALGDDYIKAKVSGKRPREYNGMMSNLAVFSIAWSGAINTIYDLAGRGSRGATQAGANMIRGIEARKGKASRVLWPAYLANADEVQQRMQQLIDDLLRRVKFGV
jgi:hypothetical protein